MKKMFYVCTPPYALRSTPVVPSRVQSQFEAASPHRPPSIVCAPLLTRQEAKAFNQKLNFDTSRVTNMDGMFYVCTPPCLPYAQTPVVPSRVQSQFEAASPHRPPSIVCPPFDSTGRKGVQPAAEFRHVPRHKHEKNVLRVHSAICPTLDSSRAFQSSEPIRGCIAPPTSQYCMRPPFDSTGSKGVQPEAEFRHVPRHKHGRNVLRVHSAMPPLRSDSSRAFQSSESIRGCIAPPTSQYCMPPF